MRSAARLLEIVYGPAIGRIAAFVANRLRWRAPADSPVDARSQEQCTWLGRGRKYAEEWPRRVVPAREARADNRLRAYFDARREGRGIWKWDHYFDVYERHFARFRGGETHVLEIGIYSGGSLEMWADYFGRDCRVYGVDIEASCKRYEDASTRIFIGDQADRDFWHRFRVAVPRLDIVVDDGGHKPIQQSVSLEELLPHLSPGGVYLCEDVHGALNRFGGYMAGLVQALNASDTTEDLQNPERRSVCRTSGFQSIVDSIHFYPFATVIEKRALPVGELVAPKRGTEWEPFLR